MLDPMEERKTCQYVVGYEQNQHADPILCGLEAQEYVVDTGAYIEAVINRPIISKMRVEKVVKTCLCPVHYQIAFDRSVLPNLNLSDVIEASNLTKVKE